MARQETLVFDLYGTLVDPIGIATELDRVLADGSGVAQLWRLKQLEYAFRLTAMNQYQDFRWVTARALDFALESTGQPLSAEQVSWLVDGYDRLSPFPDTEPALRALSGHELVVLSNGSPAMIENCLRHSGLDGLLQSWLSVDEVRAFKPSPVVYEHAARRLGRAIGELRLVSSNAFDIVGAGAAGMGTAWVNRGSLPFDTLGGPPDVTVSTLSELVGAL